MALETRYAKSGDVNIAYQVVGDGPLDLVFVMGWVSHLDGFWEEPGFARFLRRLASFSRLILFDKRGTGLSDPVPLNELPTLEQRMDDVRAVMDAVGSERAALLGISEGGPLCTLFAATYPERTRALVLLGCYSRLRWAPDHPWGRTPEVEKRNEEEVRLGWGGPVGLERRAPSVVNDPAFSAWWAKYLRMSVSLGAVLTLGQMNLSIDVRHVLPAIQVPTLIVHRKDERTIPVDEARYMAERIPGARYVELPGIDHLPFVGDQDAILDEVELFLTGAQPVRLPERVLATLLAVELTNAAEIAARQGDSSWGEVRTAYHKALHEEVARYRGREIASILDGIVAAFDGPGRAIRAAETIVGAARRFGLSAHAGLHTGEVEVLGGQVGGVAVHLAARVTSHAAPHEILVSSTVKDLVAGSGIGFDPVGSQAFSGLPGEWRLFRVNSGQPAARAPATPTVPGDVHAARLTTPLSRREREVAVLLALGLSNRQVADELFISVATAERHVANILSKLGFHSRAQVAAWAVEQGLLRGSALSL